MGWFIDGAEALRSLPLSSWVLLALIPGLGWLAAAVWNFCQTRPDSSRLIGASKNVTDDEIRMYKEDVRKAGLSDNQPIRLRTSRGEFERRLIVKAAGQRRTGTVLEKEGGIELSQNVFADLRDALGYGDDTLTAELALVRNVWPGRHPDPAFRAAFRVTVWVTLLTTIISILVEYFVP